MADQRCAGGAVGGLHIGDGALDIVRHIGQCVGGERLGAVTAAGKIQPHGGKALRGKVGGQRCKVAVPAAAAGKAVAEHHQRQLCAAGQLAGQLHRGGDFPAPARNGHIKRGGGGCQQAKRRCNGQRQRGNAAAECIKCTFVRGVFHKKTLRIQLVKRMRGGLSIAHTAFKKKGVTKGREMCYTNYYKMVKTAKSGARTADAVPWLCRALPGGA